MENIKFDNLALRVLPIDSIQENYVRNVPGACFSKVNFIHFLFLYKSIPSNIKVKPTPVKNPKLVAYSIDALKLVDIDEEMAKVRFN